MEVKEYDEIYNVVADQKYPDCITKNQKDALRNKAKSSRFEMAYYITVTRSVEKGRWVMFVCVFIPNINEGIQIHHVGNHWVTSSSVGGSLAVYDSVFSGKLSTSLQCQLATIYKLMILREEDGEVVDPHIQVHVPNLPQQQGVADCGVYAIAYAFHAARGDSLEDIEFGRY